MRPNNRANDALRPVRFSHGFTKHAEGSVLVEFGDTKVVCTASVEAKVPRWMKGEGRGWVTAEYGMLPRSTGERMGREAARGKQGGRTMEIQRLIGRSLRAACDLRLLDGFTVTLDCDVIQADGGTRTASISGAFVAMRDAFERLLADGALAQNPIVAQVASVSVGVLEGEVICDLEYVEDCVAQTDMNVVMTDAGEFVELQGTAEGATFNEAQLAQMLAFARQAIGELFVLQNGLEASR